MLKQYTVKRKLGEGSFGTTYLGIHTILGEPVCIKELHPEAAADPVFRKMFREEAKLLWRVHHVSLPTLRDYVEEPDYQPLMVMPSYRGTISRRGWSGTDRSMTSILCGYCSGY